MSGVYRDLTVEKTTDAGQYLIIPRYAVAIPAGITAGDQLAAFLVSQGDYQLPETVESYPTVTREMLALHFPNYEILPKLAMVERVRPVRSLTYTEREKRKTRLKEQAKRELAERRAADLKRRRVTVNLLD